MKKLIFNQGDETRPKFEDLRDKDVLNNSIFSDIYDRAFSLINEITNPPKKDGDTNNSKPEYNRERNNIIAFIGERGSGKTSCLKSVYHSLYNDNPKSRPYKILETKTTFNNQLPIIDPSYFDEHSNIIEIVIAHMFKSFKDAVNRSNHCLDGDNLEKKRKLVKKFQDVKEALDCTKPKGNKSISNDSIEQLSKLASGSNLHDSMEELVDCYLNYFKSENDDNSQVLVIAIDDLDVQTSHTYQMVEQIRKYLIIDKVLILMGVKLVQLSDLIKKKFVEDFKYRDKDNNIVLNDQIDDMVARYLLKLLPLSHRLNLPSYTEIPGIKLEIAPYNNNIGGNVLSEKTDTITADEKNNLHEIVLALIYRKTGIMFYNFKQDSLIVPHNLRELLNLIAMLNNLKDEEKHKNRNIFRQYFIESWCLQWLTPQQYMFIKELSECDAMNINQYIINYILPSNLDCYNSCQVELSIAEVNKRLTIMSNSNDTLTQRFVFAIKTVYSMILQDKYDYMKIDSNTKFHAKLLCNYLINNSISYRSINKLSHVFDYEKMIGGNVSDIFLEKANKLPYSGSLKVANICKFYSKLQSLLQPDNLGDGYKTPEKEKISFEHFNVFELLLLFTVKYKVSSKLNTYYYNSFPIASYPSKGSLQFNITALLYNITRYSSLYSIYLEIKNDTSDDIQKLDLVKFFKLIEAFKDDSIIYQLVKKDTTLDFSKRSAITNIEVLELLDYYLDRRIDVNTSIKDALQTLVDFKYYLYDTKVVTRENDPDKLLQLKIDYVEHSVNAGNNNFIQTIKGNIYNALGKVVDNNFESIFMEYE